MLSTKVKILIFDDSKLDAELMIRELESSSFEGDYKLVEDGIDFEEAVIDWQPDLVITDFNVSLEYSGLRALKFCKNYDPDLPIIAVSGSINEEMEVKLLEERANDVIIKRNLSRLPFAAKKALQERNQKRKLQELVLEKETLVQEVHHRVKNNLALVSGFFSLERFKNNHPETKNLIITNLLRIKSLAIVHELIYQTRNFSKVNVRELIDSLAQSVSQSDGGNAPEFVTNLDDSNLFLNVNQAIPFGLLFVEIFDKLVNSGLYVQQIDFSDPIEIRLYTSEENIQLEITQDSVYKLFAGFEKISDFTEITGVLCSQLDATMYTSPEKKSLRIEFRQKPDAKGAGSNFIQ